MRCNEACIGYTVPYCGEIGIRMFMCGGIHCGEVEGLVSVERWSCNRGASCLVEYTMGRLRDWSL